MSVSQLFRALGDPIRLEIVQRLSSESAHTISTVSSGLGISRQGVRKHIQLLADAEVITLKPKGRDTSVHLNKDTLDRGKLFIEKLEYRWEKRLEALRRFVDEEK